MIQYYDHDALDGWSGQVPWESTELIYKCNHTF